ncbi:MAG: ParB/RepB/Spo0J family partition protein [Candidatus Woesebacteria bacterium]|jgi:ParB family chromosome partitioning protein
MTQNNPTTLSVSQLQPNPFQPREKIKKEDLDELVQSIKTYGILEPLVIAQTPAGYQIIAGERRWRASKLAGLKEVPVYIKKTTPRGMLEMALVENVQRLDLNAIERAQAFQQLMRDFRLSATDLAKRIGKSPAYISNSLKLLKLPDAIKDGLIGKQITEGHARALSGIEDEKLMVNCYKLVLKEGASVRRAEELSRRFKESVNQKTKAGRPTQKNDEVINKWQRNSKAFFNVPAKMRLSRSKSQTKVTIILKGSLEATQDDLEKIMKLTNES